MIEANRLTSPGERAALERVEEVAARIDGLRLELFALSRLDLPDPDEHARLVAEVEAEAERCGRRALLGDVCERVRDALRMRLGQPLRLDPIGRYPLSPTRADDAALVEMAVTDAVAVAVMEDRISSNTAARLSAPGRALLGLPLLGDPGAAPVDRPLVPEPTAEDWAAAEPGDAPAESPSVVPATGRIVAAVVIACTVGPAALFAGVAGGSTAVGILAGLGVVALCWLLATYRR